MVHKQNTVTHPYSPQHTVKTRTPVNGTKPSHHKPSTPHLPHAAVARLLVLVRLDELQLAAFVPPPEVAAGQQQQDDDDAAQRRQATDQHDAGHAERCGCTGVRQIDDREGVCGMGGRGRGGGRRSVGVRVICGFVLFRCVRVFDVGGGLRRSLGVVEELWFFVGFLQSRDKPCKWFSIVPRLGDWLLNQ